MQIKNYNLQNEIHLQVTIKIKLKISDIHEFIKFSLFKQLMNVFIFLLLSYFICLHNFLIVNKEEPYLMNILFFIKWNFKIIKNIYLN